MSCAVGVFGSVTIRRAIATPRPSALLAGAQVHPRGTDLHALFADAFVWKFNVSDRSDMCANFGGHVESKVQRPVS